MADAAASGSYSGGPNYAEQTDKLVNFLQDYEEDDSDGERVHKYRKMLQQVANRRSRVVYVDLDDVHAARLVAGLNNGRVILNANPMSLQPFTM
jgi:hypothetical protein